MDAYREKSSNRTSSGKSTIETLMINNRKRRKDRWIHRNLEDEEEEEVNSLNIKFVHKRGTNVNG